MNHTVNPECPVCFGQGQVCQAHPFLAWGRGLRGGYYPVEAVCWCEAGPRACACSGQGPGKHNAQEHEFEMRAVEDYEVESEGRRASRRSDLWDMVMWGLFAMAITAVFGTVLNLLEAWL